MNESMNTIRQTFPKQVMVTGYADLLKLYGQSAPNPVLYCLREGMRVLVVTVNTEGEQSELELALGAPIIYAREPITVTGSITGRVMQVNWCMFCLGPREK